MIVDWHPTHEDKAGHALAGFCLGLGAAGVAARVPGLPRGWRIAIAAAVPVAAGVAKEWIDHRRGGRFDLGDLAATSAGGGAALSLTCTF